jgi:hypothetical protein
MIVPPSGLSGTQGRPITVRALNDGAVLIDGQWQRNPVELNNNNWFVLEGFNAKNGYDGGVEFTGSHDNVVRRVVVWDTHIARNRNTTRIIGSSRNLFEDVGIFGTGRKGLNPYGSSSQNVFRRVWVRFEGSITEGPKFGISTEYGSSKNNRFENVLVTWSAESMPQSYTLTDGSGNPIAGRTYTNYEVQNSGGLVGKDSKASDPCTEVKLLGVLAYLKASDRWPNKSSGAHGMISQGGSGQSCVQIHHTLAVRDGSHPEASRIFGFGHSSSSSTNNVQSRSTSISAGNIFGTFSVGTLSKGASIEAIASPWTSNASGANLCYRYGTNTPLWPWPMNTRIKNATASAGRYNGPCPDCVGGRRIRTATDVTADVESLLGEIPHQCRQ